MKIVWISLFILAVGLPVHAKVRNVLTCADEYTMVKIDTTGEFGSDEYQVLITDLRNGDEFPYRAVLKNGSFVSTEKGNPTINMDSESIAFVKSGWGLVVIEGENCSMNMN